jgi:hypothetical protein
LPRRTVTIEEDAMRPSASARVVFFRPTRCSGSSTDGKPCPDTAVPTCRSVGDTFKRSMLGADEASVKLRIEQLVRYLETIQGRPTSR